MKAIIDLDRLDLEIKRRKHSAALDALNEAGLLEWVRDSLVEAYVMPSVDGCVCGEINARNCPVHGNEGGAK